MNVDENLTAENIVSNDVTAIDAATGDAANMAADVNYLDTRDNSVANLPENGPATMPKVRAKKSEPATTNTTAAAPANTSDNSAE
jgi:hypothetical protein